MKMVKLSDTVTVMPDEISAISLNYQSGIITVKMKNGTLHSVGHDYGMPIAHTHDRLVNEINEALK